MRLRYVGLKVDGENAFRETTGICWMPGSSHDVDDGTALLMLKHPDVWALGESVEPASPGLADVDEFAGKTDEELHQLAKERGWKVHHKLAGENLRAKIKELKG